MQQGGRAPCSNHRGVPILGLLLWGPGVFVQPPILIWPLALNKPHFYTDCWVTWWSLKSTSENEKRCKRRHADNRECTATIFGWGFDGEVKCLEILLGKRDRKTEQRDWVGWKKGNEQWKERMTQASIPSIVNFYVILPMQATKEKVAFGSNNQW